MSNPDFDAFVKRQQSEEKEEQAVFDPKRQLEEWLHHLDQLYAQITKFLDAYARNGAAQITYREIPLNEEFSGPYSAREMLLKIGRRTITFTPIGTMLIGSKGRVDVQGPRGNARLTLIDKNVTSASQLIQVRVRFPGQPAPPPPERPKNIEWTWKIVGSPPTMKFTELTQESFFDMILAVADA